MGIEPTPALRGLERAILSQDPALDLGRTAAALAVPSAEADRAVLALAADEEGLNDLLSVAEQLARPPGRELIIVRLLSEEGDVEDAAARLKARRASIAPASMTCAPRRCR